MSAPRRLVRAFALCTVTALTVAGCSSAGSAGVSSAARASSTGASATSTAAATAPGTSSAARASSSRAARSSAPAVAVTACVRRTYEQLTPAQRAGQLLMIGLESSAGPHADDSQITAQHVGNVVYLGGWSGASLIRATSEHLQAQAGSTATGNVGLLIAADQEGGAVQQLHGAGLTSLVSALQQGTMSVAARTAYATMIGRQLKSVGANLDLAPVADTVPSSMAASNAPIGSFGREYGHSPGPVARSVGDVVRGLDAAGVGATVKHFPGLGRITGNTDDTTIGTTDTVTTAHDSYLRPFAVGMRAGAAAVMVSSARYTALDPGARAPFSSAIVTGLLRDELGWHGVVITDDMNAVAVASVPVGQRAVRFIVAGGDIVLTGRAGDAATMIRALLSRAGSDPGFAAKLQASTERVLTLKQRLGLLRC